MPALQHQQQLPKDLTAVSLSAPQPGPAHIDDDGDLDLFLSNISLTDHNALYLNQNPDRRWLVVRLAGQRSNRMGLGARLRVLARIDDQDRWQTRWMLPATGYASQNEPIVLFELGNAERVAALEVWWPSGVVHRVEAVGVDQVVEVAEGEGRR